MILSLLQYEEKVFVRMKKEFSVSQQMWESVRANNKKAVYRLIVCCGADVSAVYRQGASTKSLILPRVRNLDEAPLVRDFDSVRFGSAERATSKSLSSLTHGANLSREDNPDGCSLLHIACQFADIGMVELLLQYGAEVNTIDSKGQTPLHYCITGQKSDIAKVLLMRYFFVFCSSNFHV